MNFDIII